MQSDQQKYSGSRLEISQPYDFYPSYSKRQEFFVGFFFPIETNYDLKSAYTELKQTLQSILFNSLTLFQSINWPWYFTY